jgi:ABC-type multidrug transport system fused ATPase/permease subunit
VRRLDVAEPWADAAPSMIIRLWLADPDATTTSSIALYVSLYAVGYNVAYPIFNTGQSYFRNLAFTFSSSRQILGDAWRALLAASLSYHEANPLGRLLNRFSADSYDLDKGFPENVVNPFVKALGCLGYAVFAVIAWPPFAGVLAVCVAAMAVAVAFFARSSLPLRRLDQASKSPLYDLFGHVIQPDALRTIRAFRAEPALIRLHTRRLETSQRPWFLLRVAQRWIVLAVQISALSPLPCQPPG